MKYVYEVTVAKKKNIHDYDNIRTIYTVSSTTQNVSIKIGHKIKKTETITNIFLLGELTE